MILIVMKMGKGLTPKKRREKKMNKRLASCWSRIISDQEERDEKDLILIVKMMGRSDTKEKRKKRDCVGLLLC